ncbi:MAG: nucleoside hydrolase [Actinomycetota bacterium]
MSRRTSDLDEPSSSDRHFYATLWGTHNRLTHRREAWEHLRAQAGFTAVVTLAILICYLVVAPRFQADRTPVIRTGASGAPTATLHPAVRPTTSTGPSAAAGSGNDAPRHAVLSAAGEPAGTSDGTDDAPPPERGTAPGGTATTNAAAGAATAGGTTNTSGSDAGTIDGGTTEATNGRVVILDTTIGSDVDDTLAIAALHGYAVQGDLTFAAITLSDGDPTAIGYADALNHFFRASPTIGTVDPNPRTMSNDAPFHRAIAADTDRFRADQPTLAEPAVTTLRRTLAAAPDGSVTIIAGGPLTNLAELLASPADTISPLSGTRLVDAKVERLTIAGGDFAKERPELNVVLDADAARTVLDDWPTPILMSGWSVGAELLFPGEELLKIPAADSPVVEAFTLYGANALATEFPYFQPTFALSAVVGSIDEAVNPVESGFTISQPGEVTVDGAGITSFSPGGHGRHQLLRAPASEGSKAAAIDRFVELIADGHRHRIQPTE